MVLNNDPKASPLLTLQALIAKAEDAGGIPITAFLFSIPFAKAFAKQAILISSATDLSGSYANPSLESVITAMQNFGGRVYGIPFMLVDNLNADVIARTEMH